MTARLRPNRAPIRPDALAAALALLVTLGWIMSQTPNRASVYLADSPPSQTETAQHGAVPVAAGTGLAAILGAIR
jgi:hypothetical protein